MGEPRCLLKNGKALLMGATSRCARWGALVALIGTVAVGGGLAFATIPDSHDVIHACYKKSGGTIRVIDTSVTNCASNETALDWNTQGPVGQQGEIGPEGPQGPAGPGAKMIAGFVDSTGAIREGSGFSVIRSSTGNYTVLFPPGTWSSFPVMTVTAHGSFGNLGEVVVLGGEVQGDGRATYTVLMSRTTSEPINNSFNFIAVES